ncbi:MAG: HEAT repeat domain-containing protein [Lentisphaerae bacterium]|nr:HEAT repeat domain-containing protein [Lentisphaerota bacterium]MBT4815723.1 HEAT repeat domain-containing protein [Lentisphaerota bacterium]MBT5609974.1 HEAT repeat domain-containing protein [Lentisphaerota bacterium]MBT7055516.1 HEAT repeat domain-containing protein [Lentisphaerota bacterium]MBT7843627.1 HEAT repeat domain-containing protein [Lentisphaerota bacterium]
MPGKKGIRALWSVGLVMLGGTSLLASHAPKTGLRESCAEAEIIVVGRVSWAKATGRETTREKYGRQLRFSVRRAELVVKQVARGKIQHDRTMVEFLGVPDLGGSMGSRAYFRLEDLIPGEMHVVLLHDREEGEDYYTLVNDYQSVIHIGESEAVTRLLATGPEQHDAENYVASLLATSFPELSSYSEMVTSLEDLVSLRGKQSVATLKDVLDRSQDPRIKGWILGMLLRLEDRSSVQRAVEFLTEDDESDKAVVDAKRRVSTWLMCVKDKSTVEEYIVPLLKNPEGFVRWRASCVLREAKCARAVPDLVAGLEDTDQRVRHQCLMGLAETMDRGGHWGPGIELLEKDEQTYIKRWQDWWEKEGQELSAKLRRGEIATFPRPARARHPRLPVYAPEMGLREVCAGSETVVVGKSARNSLEARRLPL